jgi:hypothetical protein
LGQTVADYAGRHETEMPGIVCGIVTTSAGFPYVAKRTPGNEVNGIITVQVNRERLSGL